MLKTFCFCSGQYYPNSSTTNIYQNSSTNLIPKRDSSEKSKIKRQEVQNLDSISSVSNSGDDFSSSNSFNSTNKSSNSIHFYHPKSIQSDMLERKKQTNQIYSSSYDGSVLTTSSSLNSSIKPISDTVISNAQILKPSLPLSQPPALIKDQFHKFNLIKRSSSSRSISNKTSFKLESEKKLIPRTESNYLKKANNVDIYESINSSQVASKDLFTKTEEITQQEESFDQFSKIISEKSSDSLNKLFKINENNEIDSLGSFRNVEEPVAYIQEAYNNNMSGQEIIYSSHKSDTLPSQKSNTEKSKNKSELFIMIDKRHDSQKKRILRK